uniref:rRNA-processing protein EFG1 n=1 Tax=Neospora caninum (strain Liverpool) TaxID=572307 RepID=A0A0F7U7L8_NEOCL|nr:TPA: hypothetical protein BN1204_016860 [Neospora caninum Liverpool]
MQMGHPQQTASGGPGGPSDRLKRGKFGGKRGTVPKRGAADKKGRNKTAKAKARDLRRLLLKKREGLPPEVVTRLEEQITSLDSAAVQQKKNEKRKRFLVKRKQLYDKIKFYEGQKVRRKIKAERRILSDLLRRRRDATTNAQDAGTLDASIEEHQRALRKHLDDLNYILRYPADEPYIALFPSGGPASEETEKKREEMRAKIRQKILQERIEDDGEDNAEGGEEDNFLVAEKPAGPRPTPVLFDSDGCVVTDDEEDAEDAFAEAPDWVDGEDASAAGRGRQTTTRGAFRGGLAERKRGRSFHAHQHGSREGGFHERGDGTQAGARGRRETFSREQKRGPSRDGDRRSPLHSGRGRASIPGSREIRAESKAPRHEASEKRKREVSSQGTDGATESRQEGRERRDEKRAGKQIEQIGLSKRFAGIGKHTVFESDSE